MHFIILLKYRHSNDQSSGNVWICGPFNRPRIDYLTGGAWGMERQESNPGNRVNNSNNNGG
jgi:hypothetical protein